MPIKTTLARYQETIEKTQLQIEQEKKYHELCIFGLQPNKNKFHGFLLFLLMVVVFFVLIWQSWIIALYILVSMFQAVYYECKMYRQKKFYKSIKPKMMRRNNIFVSRVWFDIEDKSLSAQQVMSIENSIKDITNYIEKYSEYNIKAISCVGKSGYFMIKNYFMEEQNLLMKKEVAWLMNFIASFSQDLNFWTERHKMELSQLEENIDQQKKETMLPEWKLALELSQDRISRLTQEADMIRTAQK